jgi:hypothetical protein
MAAWSVVKGSLVRSDLSEVLVTLPSIAPGQGGAGASVSHGCAGGNHQTVKVIKKFRPGPFLSANSFFCQL